jgi:hypothetical protein
VNHCVLIFQEDSRWHKGKVRVHWHVVKRMRRINPSIFVVTIAQNLDHHGFSLNSRLKVEAEGLRRGRPGAAKEARRTQAETSGSCSAMILDLTRPRQATTGAQLPDSVTQNLHI